MCAIYKIPIFLYQEMFLFLIELNLLDYTEFPNDTSKPEPRTQDVRLGNQEVPSAP